MVDWWTGTTPRRRPTAEQRQLAGQWLAQTGRAVTAEAVAELAPHVRVTGKPEPHEVQAFARLVRRGQVPTAGASEARWRRGRPAPPGGGSWRRPGRPPSRTSPAPGRRPRPTCAATGSAPGTGRAGASCGARPAGRGRSPTT